MGSQSVEQDVAAEGTLAFKILDFDLGSPVDAEIIDRIASCSWDAGAHLVSELRGESHFCTGDRLIAVIAGGEIQAFATLAAAGALPGDSRGPWVGFVYCWPEARGRGLARAAVERACSLAGEAGVGRVFVASARDSLGLYLACGFEELEAAETPWGEEIVVCERALRP